MIIREREMDLLQMEIDNPGRSNTAGRQPHPLVRDEVSHDGTYCWACAERLNRSRQGMEYRDGMWRWQLPGTADKIEEEMR